MSTGSGKTFEIYKKKKKKILEMIASTDGKYYSKIRAEHVLLLTAQQGLPKYKVNSCDVRRTRGHTFR